MEEDYQKNIVEEGIELVRQYPICGGDIISKREDGGWFEAINNPKKSKLELIDINYQ